MGGPNTPQQAQDSGRPPFWKKNLNHDIFPTVWVILTKLAWWRTSASYRWLRVKISNFWNPRWRQLPYWKNRKIATPPTDWPIFTKLIYGKMMQNGSTPRPLKILNFKNSIWRKAAILKTVKSQYLRNHLADFDKIWHDEARWPPTAEQPLKFRIFENPKWWCADYVNGHFCVLQRHLR